MIILRQRSSSRPALHQICQSHWQSQKRESIFINHLLLYSFLQMQDSSPCYDGTWESRNEHLSNLAPEIQWMDCLQFSFAVNGSFNLTAFTILRVNIESVSFHTSPKDPGPQNIRFVRSPCSWDHSILSGIFRWSCCLFSFWISVRHESPGIMYHGQ